MNTTENLNSATGETVIQQDASEIVSTSFLDYAMSVITDRALPSITDGLKPVQRKILYSMYLNNLTPSANYHKCATTVGHVIGSLSPHGDTSTYDALVNLSQPINMRYPLIDFNGNNGNPLDGDPPAAYRYCVTGDTIIKTNYGNLPIKDLVNYADEYDYLHDVWVENYKGNMVPANKFFNSGKHPVYKVTLQNGQSIKCTSNHPLMTLNNNLDFKWKTVSELTTNDKILVPHFTYYASKNKDINENDILMAKAIGTIIAKTYVYNDNLYSIATNDLGALEIVKLWCESLIDTDDYNNITKNDDTLYEYKISDNIYAIISNQYQFIDHNKKKYIPDVILTGNYTLQASFIQSIIDSICYIEDERIYSEAYNIEFLRQIQIILIHTFGINSEIQRIAPDKYKLCISDFYDLLKIKVYFDFSSDEKSNMLIQAIQNNQNESIIDDTNLSLSYQEKLANIETNYRYIQIADIEACGEDIVYSIRVDDEDSDHSFIANGFINHNTESKLAHIGYDMLDGIDKNTVEFVPNFDNTKTEPTTLSGLIPNLLINGSSGIAVGMACNLVPHNISEVYDALIYYIDQTVADKAIDKNTLYSIIKGPDFPLGGTILGTAGIRDYFETGRGSVKVKANYTVKTAKHNTQIIFNNLPYKVNKSDLVKCIDNLIDNGVFPEIKEIRDESSKDCRVRIVIDVKKDANIDLLLNKLFSKTSLQTSIGVNNVVLVDGKPETVNLDTMLTAFLSHSVNVVYNYIAYENNKLNNRINIVNAILIASCNVDTIIPILRDSDSEFEDLRATNLFDNDAQIEYILNMPLKNISHINSTKYSDELNNLNNKAIEYNALMNDQSILLKYIKDKYIALKKKYGDERRTIIEEAEYTAIDESELIAEEPIVISYTNNDIIKSVSEKEYKTQSRNGKGTNQYIDEADNDSIKKTLYMSNKDDLLFFTNTGRCHIIKAYRISKVSKITKGKHINNYIKLDAGEKVVNIIAADAKAKNSSFVFVTRNGIVKKMSFDLLPKRGNVTKVTSLIDGDMLADIDIIDNTQENCSIVIVTSQGKVLSMSQDKIRASGKLSRGVKGIKLHGNDYVVKVLIAFDKATETKEHLLTITENGFAKQTSCSVYTDKGRNGSGIASHKITEESGQIATAVIVNKDNELLVSTKYGKMIRVKVSEIRACGRVSTGVRLIKLQDNDIVSSVSVIDMTQEDKE